MRRNLYGTLSDVSCTATHVVCPICGKSSSLRSFPAGTGADLVLQTFQGLGRGKGFSVVSRESGIDDAELARELKPKLLGLLGVFVAHGHASADEILTAIGAEAASAGGRSGSSPGARMRMLQTELTVERHTRAFLETDIAQLKRGLARSLDRWRDASRQLAATARELDRLREKTERLTATTREGVESLQRLRAELRASPSADKALAEHTKKMRAIVEVVRAIRERNPTAPRERGPDQPAR